MKLAYYYQGNKDYIDGLIDYDLTLLIDDEKYVTDLSQYNVDIKMIKHNQQTFDVLIAETDNLKSIFATKKVVIGNVDQYKNKIYYISRFDIDKILEKPQKQNIKFSIIVPNYNNGDWINKTIESVLDQTYDNWEMYIIDDLSTDNSIEVINQYKDSRIVLIESEIKLYNGGSRNVGILKAKKSNPDGYLLFIDSDDWLADNNVLKTLNDFIDDEDLITIDYQYYMDNKIKGRGTHTYRNIDDLFMTYGAMCAVWCKCFKVSVAPLFEFNTLMEDRNYHYRLINKIKTFANLGKITYTWNKMNRKSITSDRNQKYNGALQAKLEWDHCAYRHIAGMLDLLNELDNPKWRDFINQKINACKQKVSMNVFEQF